MSTGNIDTAEISQGILVLQKSYMDLTSYKSCLLANLQPSPQALTRVDATNEGHSMIAAARRQRAHAFHSQTKGSHVSNIPH